MLDKQSEPEIFLTAPQLRQRFGGKSDMWLWRLLREEPRFPKPLMIRRNRYWRLSAIEAFERLMEGADAQAAWKSKSPNRERGLLQISIKEVAATIQIYAAPSPYASGRCAMTIDYENTFDWKEAQDDNVCQQAYEKIVIYPNVCGDVVLRQQRAWDEEHDNS
jgi:hypothetical protein